MLPKLSVKQKLVLLQRYSDPEEIFQQEYFHHEPLDAEAIDALENKDLSAARAVVKSCAEKHISILTYSDAAYPSRLRGIADPPLVLYYKGVLPDFESSPVIGVVGTRKASGYGMTNAYQIAGQIAACGGLVVSGGAYGVDTKALEGALDAGKQTVVVLGGGVDVVYPRSNKALFARIEENGCLMSEYLPGAEPLPWNFLERNRIISGLSNGVLVVEAPEKSGALITARDALEQGRDVFVIPGNIGVATCEGSNRLLQEYAAAAISGWDVVKEYAPLYPDTVEQRRFVPQTAKVAQPVQIPVPDSSTDKKVIDNRKTSAYSDLENKTVQLTEEETKLLSYLDTEPKPVDLVIDSAGMQPAKVLSMLTRLALKGVVTNHPGKMVSLNHK